MEIKKKTIFRPPNYVRGVRDFWTLCTRVLRKAGVTVHIKPYNTLRALLVHPKYKVAKEHKSRGIYHTKCEDCGAAYVGETERSISKRLPEHYNPAKPVGHHAAYNHHRRVSPKDVDILHQGEPNWFRRGVAEAIHIYKEQPILNENRGRHLLPPIYREIITRSDPDDTSGSLQPAPAHFATE